MEKITSSVNNASSDRPNPVSAKPSRTEPFFLLNYVRLNRTVRPYLPNMFGHIFRACSAQIAEHVRSIWPIWLCRFSPFYPT